MSLWESVMVSLENLRINKMRSFLTIIGIVVGIAAVVTIVSIGQAGKTSLVSDLSKYGKGFFVVLPSPSNQNSVSNQTITMNDLTAVRLLKNVKAASGTVSQMMTVTSGKDAYTFNITGTTAEMAQLEHVDMMSGHFFNGAEERSRQRVVVIESDYADKIFGSPQKAVDRKIVFNGKVYRIIGVYKSAKSLFSNPKQKVYAAYMPIFSLPVTEESANYHLGVLYVESKVTDTKGLQSTMDEVKKFLAKRHNADISAYYSQTGASAEEMVNQVFTVLQTIIGSIAGISLFVGGVGVMNIMLVSVTERTREIGIRKAIGATPANIMWQFMMEAVVLCFLGGLIGTLIGLLGAYIFAAVTKWPFIVSWWVVLLAFGFSAAVGLFFGLYPANKAARMQPIESLRYE